MISIEAEVETPDRVGEVCSQYAAFCELRATVKDSLGLVSVSEFLPLATMSTADPSAAKAVNGKLANAIATII